MTTLRKSSLYIFIALISGFLYWRHSELTNTPQFQFAEDYIQSSSKLYDEIGKLDSYEVLSISRTGDAQYHYFEFSLSSSNEKQHLALWIYKADSCSGYSVKFVLTKPDKSEVELQEDCYK